MARLLDGDPRLASEDDDGSAAAALGGGPGSSSAHPVRGVPVAVDTTTLSVVHTERSARTYAAPPSAAWAARGPAWAAEALPVLA